MSLAGVVGNTVGSVIGWGIGYYGGRPLIERHGRWLHLGPENARPGRALVRALGRLGRLPRPRDAGRALVRLDPGRRGRMPLGRFTVLTFLGLHPLVLRDRGRRLGARLALRGVPPRLPLRRTTPSAALLVVAAVVWYRPSPADD